MWTNTKWYWKKKRSNWKTNYEHYFWSKKAIWERSTRNKARRKMEKVGKAKKWDGKDVHHKKWISWWNGKSNLAVISRKKNRKLGAAKATRAKKNK